MHWQFYLSSACQFVEIEYNNRGATWFAIEDAEKDVYGLCIHYSFAGWFSGSSRSESKSLMKYNSCLWKKASRKETESVTNEHSPRDLYSIQVAVRQEDEESCIVGVALTCRLSMSN
jgi:hypothetical protein